MTSLSASHDGFGDLKLEIRLLRRGQKEALLFCGKQFRFVVNNSPVRFVERRKQARELPEPDNRTEEKEQSESRKTAIQLYVYPAKSRALNNLGAYKNKYFKYYRRH